MSVSVSVSVYLSAWDIIKLARGSVVGSGVGWDVLWGHRLLVLSREAINIVIIIIVGLSLLLFLLCFGPNPRNADGFVSVLFGVGLWGASVGLCVYTSIKNKYPCCSYSCWRITRCQWMQSTSLGRSSLFILVFVLLVSRDLSAVDAIKLGGVSVAVGAVGEMSLTVLL